MPQVIPTGKFKRGGWIGLLAAMLFALSVAGCATTPESNMPWNSPHSWEAGPSIPGMGG